MKTRITDDTTMQQPKIVEFTSKRKIHTIFKILRIIKIHKKYDNANHFTIELTI